VLVWRSWLVVPVELCFGRQQWLERLDARLALLVPQVLLRGGSRTELHHDPDPTFHLHVPGREVSGRLAGHCVARLDTVCYGGRHIVIPASARMTVSDSDWSVCWAENVDFLCGPAAAGVPGPVPV
jgi:hypothetical protein